MTTSSIYLSFCLLAISLSTQAAPPTELRFSHNDWEISCDNTRTCRAAGYQVSDSDDAPGISVLLTRKAGPRQAIQGELLIGNFVEDKALAKLPSVMKLSMRVNGRNIGQVVVHKDSFLASLSEAQVAALISALPRNSSIEWSLGKYRWKLSDKGAAAVLLKMDEFQGRIGTPGAIIKKGSLNENSVLAPIPMPVVQAVALTKTRPSDELLATMHAAELRRALSSANLENVCSTLSEGDDELSIVRLSNTKLLASIKCWQGAYNTGYAYWVINDKPPYLPILVTENGTDFTKSSITASHKGRGIGDCWYSESWTWDGKTFVKTESLSTGMCKAVAVGGAWTLPTLVTDVRQPARITK